MIRFSKKMPALLGSLSLGLLLMTSACSNGGTTTVVNPPDPPTKVTISQLVNGSAIVSVGLGVFGDSTDDLTGATVDIGVNNQIVQTAVEAPSHYSEDSQYVEITVDNLVNNDFIQVRVNKADSTNVTYAGNVSSDQEVEIEVIEDEEGNGFRFDSAACSDRNGDQDTNLERILPGEEYLDTITDCPDTQAHFEVSFNMNFDPSTVNNATVILQDYSVVESPVDVAITLDAPADSDSFTFIPDAPLTSGITYRITITGEDAEDGIESSEGGALRSGTSYIFFRVP